MTLPAHRYTVARWLEQCAAEDVWGLVPDTITVHSVNAVGTHKMIAAIAAIESQRQKD